MLNTFRKDDEIPATTHKDILMKVLGIKKDIKLVRDIVEAQTELNVIISELIRWGLMLVFVKAQQLNKTITRRECQLTALAEAIMLNH